VALRVHELAKELKISTAALRMHLKDLGVSVKSHMSFVEDDNAAKLRMKFLDQIAAIKKMETARKQYSGKPAPTPEPIRKPEPPKPAEPSVLDASNTEPPRNPEFDKVEVARREMRTFVEHPIKMAAVPKAFSGTRPDKREQPRPTPRPAPQQAEPQQPAAPLKTDVAPDGTAPREVPVKKVDSRDLGNKSKHIQAKLKNTKKGRKKKFEPTEAETAEIARGIRATLASGRKRKRYKKDERPADAEPLQELVISEFTSVSELAKIMNVQPTEIIAEFFKMGQMVTINQRLDKESREMICDEFEFDVKFQEEYGTEMLDAKIDDQVEAEELPRPPVVTIMGHVDHGKTSILDYIRKSNVIAGEAGGITQHIGAYQVEYSGRRITFIDTPGHEAFTAMRARGANVTDIAVIVVAANDGVKPQTIEALDHARAAGVTIIIAINKVDLSNANIDKTINGLAEQKVFLEGYGGQIQWVKTSALSGLGIDDLLENILLAADMGELKAKYDVPARGVVIESKKDARIGAQVTILLREGRLRKGDIVVCGATFGRVRRLEDERGGELDEIGPSDVALLYGLKEVPKAGDNLHAVADDNTARQISTERLQIRHEREKYQATTTMSNLFQKIKEHNMNEVKLIVKADTDGSMEALCDSFEKLSNDEVMVNIIRRGVGGIIEADVNLAITSEAIIIGFQVRTNSQAKVLAEDNNVEIKNYRVIYDAIEDLRKAISGMLEPIFAEKFLGNARVKEVFRIRKVGAIAGCAVEKGVIRKSALVKLYRNDSVVFEGKISSLKHYAEDAAEVKVGTDCGIGIENFNDIKEGDIIEAYEMEEVERKL